MKDSVDATAAYYDPDTCDLGAFRALIDQTLSAEQAPHAASVEKNIPLYLRSSKRSKILRISSR